MDRLAVILADMVLSALSWEQEHGLPQHDSEFRPKKALTKIPLCLQLTQNKTCPKGEIMSTITTQRNTHHELTFADLKGLRAEGYIRDSTRDQKDGFGQSCSISQ